MRVLILIGGHLSTAPRPWKEARALAGIGCEVMVRGFWFDEALIANDRLLMGTNPNFEFAALTEPRPALARLRGAVARRHPWLPLAERFGRGPRLMLAEARRLRPDAVIVHSEAGLWCAAELLAERRIPVGVDFEDWFSRDLSEAARRHRPTAALEALEGTLLHGARYRLATSQAMASALSAHFTAPMPAVVRNVFPLSPRPTIEAASGPLRLHWFSQTIGPGRGLELLFAALAQVSAPVALTLRGALPDRYRQWLADATRGLDRHQIRNEAPVPNAELPAAIAEHEIGLALETPSIPSRDLTITNKLFQYLDAGLAVIATRTAGQREALSAAPGAGVLVNEEARAIARAIDAWNTDRGALLKARLAARAAAEATLNWEAESLVLQSEFRRAFP